MNRFVNMESIGETGATGPTYDCNQYPVRKLIQVDGKIEVIYLYKWPVNQENTIAKMIEITNNIQEVILRLDEESGNASKALLREELAS